MPKFNGRQWAAGIGQGIVSTGDGQPNTGGAYRVLADNAGGACWWAGHVLYQRENASGAFLESDGSVRVDNRGANRLRADGTVWAAMLRDGSGYRDSLRRVSASLNVAGVGPDGTVAVVEYGTGTGVRLLSQDDPISGGVVVPNAFPDDQEVQVLGRRQCVWMEGGHKTIRAFGIPGIERFSIVGAGAWWAKVFLDGASWSLLYQDERDRLVLHRHGDVGGYLITTGNAFRPDIAIVDGESRVVYAVNEGERPEDIRVVTGAMLAGMWHDDLRVAVVPDPGGPGPVGPGGPDPGGPVNPGGKMVPNRADKLRTFWQSYNGSQIINDLDEKHRFTTQFVQWLNETEDESQHKGRFGRKSRAGSPGIVSKDTVGYWLGSSIPTSHTDGQIDAVDVIGSDGRVSWDTRAEQGDPGYRNIFALWMYVEPAVVPDPGDGNPGGPVDPSLAGRVKALEDERAGIRADIAAARNEVEAMRGEFASLKASIDKIITGGGAGAVKYGDLIRVVSQTSTGRAGSPFPHSHTLTILGSVENGRAAAALRARVAAKRRAGK